MKTKTKKIPDSGYMRFIDKNGFEADVYVHKVLPVYSLPSHNSTTYDYKNYGTIVDNIRHFELKQSVLKDGREWWYYKEI